MTWTWDHLPFRIALIAAGIVGIGAIGLGWRATVLDEPFWGLAWIGPGVVTTSISWSPFGEAGVEAGDVILSVDGQSPNAMPELRRGLRSGDTVELQLSRGSYQVIRRVVLSAMPLTRRFAQGEKLLLALLFLVIGLAAGFLYPTDRLARTISWLGFAATLALTTNVLRFSTTNGLRITRLLELAAIAVAAHTYYSLSPSRSVTTHRRVLGGLYGTLVVVTALSFTVPFFIRQQGTLIRWWKFQNTATYWLMAIFLITAIIFLLRQTLSSAYYDRRRRILTTGLAIGLAPSLILSIGPHAYSGEPLVAYVWTHPFLTLVPLSLGYALYHGRRTAVDRAAHAIATFAASVAVVVPIVVPLYYWLSLTFEGKPLLGAISETTLAVVVGGVFGFLSVKLRPGIDQLVFRGMHGYRALVGRMSKDLDYSPKRPERGADELLADLGQTLDLDLYTLLTPDHSENGERDGKTRLISKNQAYSLEESGVVCELLARHQMPIWHNELMESLSGDERKLVSHIGNGEGNWLWVPLVADGQLTGVALFQGVAGTSPFGEAEIDMLSTLSGRIALHMRNAELHRSLENRLQEVEAFRDELAEAQQRLARERENERSHLARELHDGPLQMMFGIGYKLDALEDSDGTSEVERAQLLSDAKGALRQVSSTLRGICSNLRPPLLSDFGIDAALHSLVTAVKAAYPEANIKLERMPERRPLDVETRLALYRIAQEAVTNAIRHANATRIIVRFEHDIEQVLLEIEDDGIGFTVPSSLVSLVREDHFGLLGIQERASGIGGQLEIRSIDSGGTVISVSIPEDDIDGENVDNQDTSDGQIED